MHKYPVHVMLTDDDDDDCLFFQEALDELSAEAILTIVKDGAELMNALRRNENNLPDVLFLDLNMARKAGFECLSEIRMDEELKYLVVVIYSTSLNTEVVDALYDMGAYHYIRKPGNFTKIKEIIHKLLHTIAVRKTTQPLKEEFIFQL